MYTNDDYQERLPEHPEPLELPAYSEPKRVAAANNAAKPRPAVTADVDEVRGMGSVGWAALAALAIAVFVGAIFFFSGRTHDVDGTVTAYNASAVPARNVAASDIASVTPAQAVATNVAAAPQDVVYLFPLDGSDITENKALNGVATRAAETGAYVTVVAYTDESGRAAYNQRLRRETCTESRSISHCPRSACRPCEDPGARTDPQISHRSPEPSCRGACQRMTCPAQKTNIMASWTIHEAMILKCRIIL